MDAGRLRVAGRPGAGTEVTMSDSSACAVYRKRDGVLARRIAGEAMLVPIRGELARLQCIFSLTPVGEFIWEKLDGQRTHFELLNAVVAEFEVDAPTAEADLSEFVASLLAEDLVEEVAI